MKRLFVLLGILSVAFALCVTSTPVTEQAYEVGPPALVSENR